MEVMLIKRGFSMGFLILVILGSSLFTFIKPHKVLAATKDEIANATLSWIDRANISAKVGSNTFTFRDQNAYPGDDTMEYAIQGYPCHGTITLSLPPRGSSGGPIVNTGLFDMDIQEAQTANGNSGCQDTDEFNKSIGNTEKFNIKYVFISATDIVFADGGEIKNNISTHFVQSSNFKELYVNGSEKCADVMVVNGSSGTLYDLTEVEFPSTRGGTPRPPAPASLHMPSDCFVASTSNETLGGSASTPVSTIPGVGSSTASTTACTGQGVNCSDVTCETNSTSPLTWLLCPIFNGVSDFADWLFSSLVQPFLQTPPINVNGSDPSFTIWSNFRVYGNIVLIIALLLLVFGQAIGGGLIDAYTAKKMAPRILIAAIMINLSIYIIALLIDLTNILGNGIGQLMLAPLGQVGGLHFSPTGAQQIFAAGLGILGGTLGIAGTVGVLGSLLFGGGAALAKVAIFVGLAVLLPVVLTIIGVFVTLIIRKGLILFLIISSPVAFALYCLPNTEQYFRKWWDLLFKTLMVYPIVIAIFAIADILSITILKANGYNGTPTGGAVNGLAGVVAFVLQFLPLALVPFAFKFAGGAVASIYGAISNGAGRIHKMTEGRKVRATKDFQNLSLANRERAYQALGRQANKRSGFNRWALKQMRNRVGGYDLYAARAETRAERLKEAEATTNAGIDDQRRGLTVNKSWAHRQDRAVMDAAGTGDFNGQHVRRNNGELQYRTLGGRWINEAEVDDAHARWDGSDSDLQASVAYEMQKATTQEQMDYMYSNYGRMNQAGSGFNMSQEQFGGVWTGAAFAKQNTDRQWKHHYWDADTGQLQVSGVGMMQEIDERQGSWQMASQSADTWSTMAQEVQRARNVLATGVADGEMDYDTAHEVIQRGARIAKSLTGGYQDANGVYHESIGQGASGRTKEEMENYSGLFNWVTDPVTGVREPLEYNRESGLARRGTGAQSGAPPPAPPTRRPGR